MFSVLTLGKEQTSRWFVSMFVCLLSQMQKAAVVKLTGMLQRSYVRLLTGELGSGAELSSRSAWQGEQSTVCVSPIPEVRAGRGSSHLRGSYSSAQHTRGNVQSHPALFYLRLALSRADPRAPCRRGGTASRSQQIYGVLMWQPNCFCRRLRRRLHASPVTLRSAGFTFLVPQPRS